MIVAQANLVQMGSQPTVKELMTDKGCHDNRLLAQCDLWQVRIYIPERRQRTDKSGDCSAVGARNARRASPTSARPGAGVGAGWGGTVNVAKIHILRCAAQNLTLLLSKRFGLAKPHRRAAPFSLLLRLWSWVANLISALVQTIAKIFS